MPRELISESTTTTTNMHTCRRWKLTVLSVSQNANPWGQTTCWPTSLLDPQGLAQCWAHSKYSINLCWMDDDRWRVMEDGWGELWEPALRRMHLEIGWYLMWLSYLPDWSRVRGWRMKETRWLNYCSWTVYLKDCTSASLSGLVKSQLYFLRSKSSGLEPYARQCCCLWVTAQRSCIPQGSDSAHYPLGFLAQTKTPPEPLLWPCS